MKANFGHDSLPECEKMVECPFNKAHMVVQHRMPNHIIKCRKNQETYGVKECRFNSSHILPIREIKSHEATCPDRAIIENFLERRLKKSSLSSAASSTSGYSTVKDEDNWDDISVPTYIPFMKR